MSEHRILLRDAIQRAIIDASRQMKAEGMSNAQSFSISLTALQAVTQMLIASAPADVRADLANVFADEIKATFTAYKGH